RRQSIILAVQPAVFDRYVLALDIADVLQALAKSAQTVDRTVRRCRMEEPDHRRRRLLRTRGERPRGRASEECDEVTPSHANCPSGKAYQERRCASQQNCPGFQTPAERFSACVASTA